MENSRILGLCGGVIKYGLYLLVFLLPLFFLPFNANILELNKQLLLLVFAIALLIAWLGKIIIQSKLQLRKSFLNVGLVVFLLVSFLSAVFSKNLYQSLVGFSSGISESFFSLLALLIFFFVLVNNVEGRNGILNLAFVSVLSGLLAGIFAFLQMLDKFLLPWDFYRTVSFNTVGSVNSLEIFLAGLLILAAVLFTEIKTSLWRKIFFGIAGLFFLIMILSINFSNVWIILLIGSVIVVALGIINRDEISQFRLVLPMVILVFAVLMLFIRFNIFNFLNVPAEIFPSFGASVQIGQEAVKINPFFGAGQGNYSYIYGKYYSPELNQTNFWNIRFNQAYSKVLTLPATLGILGSAFWILIVFGFMIYGLVKLIKNRGENWALGLAVFSSWLILALGQFIYSSNLTLEFSFWLTLGLAFLAFRILGEKEGKKEKLMMVEFDRTSPLASIVSFVFVAVLVLSVSALYLGSSYYFSDILYQRSVKAANDNNLQEAFSQLSRAVQLNPFNNLYLRTLSQVTISRISEEFQKPQSNERDGLIRNLTSASIDIAKQSTDFEPLNVDNWAQRGFNYRAVMAYTSGADQWAIDCYQQATTLEPSNPYYYFELGRSYQAAADLIGSNENKKDQKNEFMLNSEEAFNKSIALKSDYAPALFQLALLYDRQGKLKEAIAKMEQTKNISSQDTGVAFQLGLLYYKNSDWSAAQAELERAVTLDKNYSNARYFLGLIYDRQGAKDKALEQFQKIAELNPGNSDVQTIVANLKAGKPAITPPQTAQPSELPIQEKTPQSAK